MKRSPSPAERVRFIAGMAAPGEQPRGHSERIPSSKDVARVLTLAYLSRMRELRQSRDGWTYTPEIRREWLKRRRELRAWLWSAFSSRAFNDAAWNLLRVSGDESQAVCRVLDLQHRLKGLALLEGFDPNLRALASARQSPRNKRRVELLWHLMGPISRRGGKSKAGVRRGHAIREIYRLLPCDTPEINALVTGLLGLIDIKTDRHTVARIRQYEGEST